MRTIPHADVRGRVEAIEFAVLWIVSRVLSERAKNQKPACHHFSNINFNSLTFLPNYVTVILKSQMVCTSEVFYGLPFILNL